MNPPEGYEHCNTPWMNMKVGDLVSVVWTEGCETPAIVGVVTGIQPHTSLFDRDGSLGYMAPGLASANGPGGLVKKIKYSGKPAGVWALGALLCGRVAGGRFPLTPGAVGGKAVLASTG